MLVSLISNRYSRIFAFLIFSLVFSIPLDSITSLVSLRPAVSMNLKFIPLIINESSMLSLVVPGISETIALSSLRSVFRRDDFPALGFPAIATEIPFFKTFPD